MKELSIEEKAKAYDEAFERAKEKYAMFEGMQPGDVLEDVFPTLKESEDERIRKEILDCFKTMKQQGCFPSKHKEQYEPWIAWLEKQGEPNPFSGVSFKYNGYTWGMCARDNGVDILLDSQLFKHLEKKDEQKSAWSEEDKNRFTNLISLVKCSKENNATKAGFIEFINKLKSLKPQSTWKPSDEQMKCISDVVADAKYKNDISTNGYEPYTHLSTLLQQLKKLREE